MLAGLALVQLQIIGSALRWRMTSRALGQPLALSRAVGEYYLATWVNQTLPGGMTGDAARVVRNRDSAASVVLERMAGQLALGGVTLAGLAAWSLAGDVALPPAARSLSLGLVVLLAGASALLIAWPRLVSRVAGGRARAALGRVGPAVHRAWWADRAWLSQGAASLGIVAMYLGLFAVAGLALGAPLTPLALLTVVPLALLTMLLPVSVGGWGVREAAAAALWPLVGLSAETGVATSILYGLLSLAGAAPALFWVGRRA